MIYALLYATLTTFARSVIILVDTRACRTMPDYARMLSFLGQRPGEILDTGLLYEDLKRQRMLDKVPFLAKNLRMELGAPAGQLIQCKNQAGAAAGIKNGDPAVTYEMIHSDQLAARSYFHGAKVLEPSFDALRRKWRRAHPRLLCQRHRRGDPVLPGGARGSEPSRRRQALHLVDSSSNR
jgi:hypothetical protein